jgi:16S rRNA (cytidine1402-2'-O)-methyltransferase
MSGALVLVSTPIGNLGDLPPRAVATLAGASAICCEDTRRTGRLLQHAGIADVPLVLLNEHTELARVREVLDLLGQGGDVALVTDAGHAVSAVPGPAALVMALVLSGLPTGRFVFEGFLPRKGRERDDRLRELATERRTIVLYESPHRLARTLGDLAEHLGGERRMAIARELTKLHEEIWHGTVDEAIQRTAALPTDPLGEHVLVVEGAPEHAPADDDTIRAALRQAMATGLDRKSAVGEVTKRLRAHKRDVYAISLTLET